VLLVDVLDAALRFAEDAEEVPAVVVVAESERDGHLFGQRLEERTGCFVVGSEAGETGHVATDKSALVVGLEDIGDDAFEIVLRFETTVGVGGIGWDVQVGQECPVHFGLG
jgi:hypothetical protein